ncbi:hypothetical protein KBC75_01775 [Candidatus Shapirobacteria bacterium]|nr:hypothetical protein [Candidatus Shapirobacteria bacterium]
MKTTSNYLETHAELQKIVDMVGRPIQFRPIHENQPLPDGIQNNLDPTKFSHPSISLIELIVHDQPSVAVIISNEPVSAEQLSDLTKNFYDGKIGDSHIPDVDNPGKICGYRTANAEFFIKPAKLVDSALTRQEETTPSVSLADHSADLVAVLLKELKKQSENAPPIVQDTPPVPASYPW